MLWWVSLEVSIKTLILSQSLAIETANSNGSQYILANDPDSDRFLAAEKIEWVACLVVTAAILTTTKAATSGISIQVTKSALFLPHTLSKNTRGRIDQWVWLTIKITSIC